LTRSRWKLRVKFGTNTRSPTRRSIKRSTARTAEFGSRRSGPIASPSARVWDIAPRRARCQPADTNMLGHAIVLAFVLARSAEAAALMQSPTSVLEGTVVDSSGQVVPGAAVEVRDGATNQRRRTESDDRGAFRFVALAPGTYDVFVQLEGFAPF